MGGGRLLATRGKAVRKRGLMGVKKSLRDEESHGDIRRSVGGERGEDLGGKKVPSGGKKATRWGTVRWGMKPPKTFLPDRGEGTNRTDKTLKWLPIEDGKIAIFGRSADVIFLALITSRR